MNIARMCMVVGVAGLLVAQVNAHDNAERKDSKKVKKSTRELVMEYLPYAGYTCAVIGWLGAGYQYRQVKKEQGKWSNMEEFLKHQQAPGSVFGEGYAEAADGTKGDDDQVVCTLVVDAKDKKDNRKVKYTQFAGWIVKAFEAIGNGEPLKKVVLKHKPTVVVSEV